MKHHTLRESTMRRRFVIAMSSLVLIPSGSLASTPPAFLPAAYVDTGVAITESAVVADVAADPLSSSSSPHAAPTIAMARPGDAVRPCAASAAQRRHSP